MKRSYVFFPRKGARLCCLLPVLFLALLVTACASVKRIDSGTVTDLSGHWNDTDVRIVCDSLIKSCLDSPRVAQEAGRLGRNPVFLVGPFRNESDEHIDTSIIADIMELTVFNSGTADFVAGGPVREALRTERQDQQVNASEATASRLVNETGADFLLTGSVKTIVDQRGNTRTRTYYVTAELTNIETNVRLWMDQDSSIKKQIKSSGARL
ncbi:MAG: penicillin-binding protein activator LpoB [Treponema sp.]|jgi:PBP1b-binding outer membrane lipoprotein LpoB|nr:penicillin-binding protein activator LpoB [Treponema sp.]